ncbi:MAG: putative bifunctional diguanylate cyclase/phosphodiesterase [Pseudomonadales bacterium]
MSQTRRTLVREVLLSQLAYALAVGMIAIGCVWWVSNWVVRDNLDDWAVRWVGEMESLGAGFFINPADERFLELRNYLSRFDEIEYVRYYGLDGQVVYVESAAGEPHLYPGLGTVDFAALSERAAADGTGDARYRMDFDRDPLVRISQAVTRESIVSANLFSAETLSELESTTTVVGFVELGLDYGGYDRDLLAGISTGIGFVALAFLVLMLAGRLAIRRAVQPLADMQAPLEAIAHGDLEVKMPASPHREIAAIGEALETALASIRERDRHLFKLANFDPLTGLSTRHHFIEQLGPRLAVATPGCGALLFVDMDQFKHVNDTYGHQAGDRVLAQVGARLRQLVRRDDLLGRFGGDEFVLYIADIDARDADAMADKLLREMSEFPLVYDDVSLSANCSLGIAMVDETSRLNPEELISQADVACRLAKSSGRNRACRYEPDEKHIEAIKSDVEWQRKLKRALKEDHFELHYQPIQNLADGTVRHYEVLVRLREGDTLFMPDQFLPAAVRFGLMRDVDHWVLDHAFAALAALRRTAADVRFAINLGGSAFTDATLASFVLGRLKVHGVPANAVIFEITEQVAVGSFSAAVPQIRELRAAGCELAVDDFGTGYSSLSYLKRLPVQYIKIDGSFVQRLSVSRVDQTIVRAIADIARIMGKKTIAEFVGDAETLTVIREIGIDYAQGYHVGKPRPVPQGEASDNQVVPIDRARRAS